MKRIVALLAAAIAATIVGVGVGYALNNKHATSARWMHLATSESMYVNVCKVESVRPTAVSGRLLLAAANYRYTYTVQANMTPEQFTDYVDANC